MLQRLYVLIGRAYSTRVLSSLSQICTPTPQGSQYRRDEVNTTVCPGVHKQPLPGDLVHKGLREGCRGLDEPNKAQILPKQGLNKGRWYPTAPPPRFPMRS